jgi:plasmid stabilization system protein ParE
VARKIVWSDLAVEDLEAAVSFVARDSPGYARSLAQLAIDAAESLASFPDRGHRLPDRTLSRYRELLVGAYRLVYLVEKERVLVVALLHGHRALRRAMRPRTAGPAGGRKSNH